MFPLRLGRRWLRHVAVALLAVAPAAGAAAGPSLPSAAERLLRHFRDLARGREELSQLTDQERRVLELVAEGKTNREIGEALSLAEKTVKNYVSSILSKLQLRRRTDAAVYAAQRRTRLGGSLGRDPGSDPP